MKCYDEEKFVRTRVRYYYSLDNPETADTQSVHARVKLNFSSFSFSVNIFLLIILRAFQ